MWPRFLRLSGDHRQLFQSEEQRINRETREYIRRATVLAGFEAIGYPLLLSIRENSSM